MTGPKGAGGQGQELTLERLAAAEALLRQWVDRRFPMGHGGSGRSLADETRAFLSNSVVERTRP